MRRNFRTLKTSNSSKKLYDYNLLNDLSKEDLGNQESQATINTLTQLQDTFGCNPELIKQLGQQQKQLPYRLRQYPFDSDKLGRKPNLNPQLSMQIHAGKGRLSNSNTQSASQNLLISLL